MGTASNFARTAVCLETGVRERNSELYPIFQPTFQQVRSLRKMGTASNFAQTAVRLDTGVGERNSELSPIFHSPLRLAS